MDARNPSSRCLPRDAHSRNGIGVSVFTGCFKFRSLTSKDSWKDQVAEKKKKHSRVLNLEPPASATSARFSSFCACGISSRKHRQRVFQRSGWQEQKRKGSRSSDLKIGQVTQPFIFWFWKATELLGFCSKKSSASDCQGQE